MAKHLSRTKSRQHRKIRIRKKIAGTAARPRLAVFRTNQHMYAQLIDDLAGRTLTACSTLKVEVEGHKGNRAAAAAVGKALAEAAREAGIAEVVFDRSGFLYHGRVKALADAAREGGLKF